MKGITIQILITITVFGFVTSGGKKKTKCPPTKDPDSILNKFGREMSILGLVDVFYNKRLHDLTIQPDEYGEKIASFHARLMKREKYPYEEVDYNSNHLYAMSEGKPSKEEAFARAYVALKAFWAAIDFRIMTLIDNKFDGILHETEESAKRCKELTLYLQWFFSLEYEKNIDDFSIALKQFTTNRKLRRSIEDISVQMSSLSLDFLMPADYFELQDVLADSKSDSESSEEVADDDNIIKWSKVPFVESDEGRKIGKSIFPDKMITGIDCKPKSTRQQKMKRYHEKIWAKVTRIFGREKILRVENFFGTTIMGDSWKDKESLDDLIPKFELSQEIRAHSSELIEIRKRDPTVPRQMQGEKGEEIRRSNAVEIIRRIMEISAIYNLQRKQLLSEKSEDIISSYKQQPMFELQAKNSRSAVGYSLVVPMQEEVVQEQETGVPNQATLINN